MVLPWLVARSCGFYFIAVWIMQFRSGDIYDRPTLRMHVVGACESSHGSAINLGLEMCGSDLLTNCRDGVAGSHDAHLSTAGLFIQRECDLCLHDCTRCVGFVFAFCGSRFVLLCPRFPRCTTMAALLCRLQSRHLMKSVLFGRNSLTLRSSARRTMPNVFLFLLQLWLLWICSV